MKMSVWLTYFYRQTSGFRVDQVIQIPVRTIIDLFNRLEITNWLHLFLRLIHIIKMPKFIHQETITSRFENWTPVSNFSYSYPRDFSTDFELVSRATTILDLKWKIPFLSRILSLDRILHPTKIIRQVAQIYYHSPTLFRVIFVVDLESFSKSQKFFTPSLFNFMTIAMIIILQIYNLLNSLIDSLFLILLLERATYNYY